MTRETWLAALVYLVWLVERTNRMNETDQMSQINPSRRSRSTVLRRRPAILDPIWNRSWLTLQYLLQSPRPAEVR
jgi:hypothetical protein